MAGAVPVPAPPHIAAPAELSHFAFLIGNFTCDARLRMPDGSWQTLKATWNGNFILDRHPIADEYRMTRQDGSLMVLGMNFRSYDAEHATWHIKWLNALDGKWTDLGTREMGGVTIDDRGITYAFKEPTAAHGFTRAAYTNISAEHFTWRGEKSSDGKSWSAFLVVECTRAEP
jgi:hypothetical protein